jgi:hypothetical protein
VLLLSTLRHRRVQRRSSLLGSVLQQFPLKLRDQIAIQPRATVFGRRAVIELDIGHHSLEEWWPIVTGLSHNLAPQVRLLVCYTDALPFPIRLSIQSKRRRGLRCYALYPAARR